MKKLLIIFVALIGFGCIDSQIPELVVENFIEQYIVKRNVNEATKFLTANQRDEFIKDNTRFDNDALQFFLDISKCKREIIKSSNVPSLSEEVFVYFSENNVRKYR